MAVADNCLSFMAVSLSSISNHFNYVSVLSSSARARAHYCDSYYDTPLCTRVKLQKEVVLDKFIVKVVFKI
jgi:hypothetical protein